MNPIIFCMLMMAQTTFTQGSLDGKAYCRPVGSKKHCLTFKQGVVWDDANAFFGNPSFWVTYLVSERRVTFEDSEYLLSDDGTTLTVVRASTVPGTVFLLSH